MTIARGNYSGKATIEDNKNWVEISLTGLVKIILEPKTASYWFECRCRRSELADCSHIADILSKREDAVFFQDDETLLASGNPMYLAVPVLSNPQVDYWVQLTSFPEAEDFIQVMHKMNVWMASGSNLESSIINDNFKRLVRSGREATDELCLLAPGDGCADIISALFDAFSAFHVKNKPDYICKNNFHDRAAQEDFSNRVGDPSNRGLELARVFFTNECTHCAIKTTNPDFGTFDDLVPRGFDQRAVPIVGKAPDLTYTTVTAGGRSAGHILGPGDTLGYEKTITWNSS